MGSHSDVASPHQNDVIERMNSTFKHKVTDACLKAPSASDSLKVFSLIEF